MWMLHTVGTSGGYVEGFGVKSIRILVEPLSISWVTTLFRQTFRLASGTSVKSTMGLILVRKSFNGFNFYSIDLFAQKKMFEK
jgi:hypothetical protein